MKKLIKLSQKKDRIKYGMIFTYLLYVIPLLLTFTLPHTSFIYTWLFRIINFVTAGAFWLFAVILGRLSGVTHGFGAYLIIFSVLLYQKFSFLLGYQILFIILFVLGTFWLIFDLLRAFLYSSTLARIDPRAIEYNLRGNIIFFIIGYLMSLAPSVSLAYLTNSENSTKSLLNIFYYFSHLLGIIAIIFSLIFYIYNSKKRLNRTTIIGNCLIIFASFITTILLYFFFNLIWSSLFYYSIGLMLLGSVLVIPININKDSLKNHDIATEN